MNRPLNILLVSDVSIASVIGGAERVLYEESTRLTQRGHSAHVLTRKLPHHQADVEDINGVAEHRYGFQLTPFPVFLSSILSDCRRTFRTLQQNSSFDLINFHQPFSAVGVISSPASRRVPMVYTCHSLSFEEYVSRTASPTDAKGWVHHRLQVVGRKLTEKVLLKRSERVVVLSEYTRRKLETLHGLPASKVSVIPGGVDLERFRPAKDKAAIRSRLGLPADKFVLFTVRNLVPRMGLENLISAFEIVLKHRSDLLLVIGGEGPLAPALKKQVEKFSIAEHIRFAGYIPDEELPSYYRVADLFILPTRELEGFGLVTLEALASGLPVLATPVGGTKEILAHLGPDFLFDDLTPESMATGILRLLHGWGEERAAHEDISKTCRKVAEQHYSWNTHVSRLEDLFYSLKSQIPNLQSRI